MTIPKFRAWDKISKTMFPVMMIDFGQSYVMIEEINGLWCERDFDEIELMQSTGLVDWEGVEVYEGDIVKIPDDYSAFGKNAGEILKVAFDSGCFRLKTFHGRGRGFYFEDNNTVEIIGNIYENPEFWEVQ